MSNREKADTFFPGLLKTCFVNQYQDKTLLSNIFYLLSIVFLANDRFSGFNDTISDADYFGRIRNILTIISIC
jgi:hypothetical protein